MKCSFLLLLLTKTPLETSESKLQSTLKQLKGFQCVWCGCEGDIVIIKVARQWSIEAPVGEGEGCCSLHVNPLTLAGWENNVVKAQCWRHDDLIYFGHMECAWRLHMQSNDIWTWLYNMNQSNLFSQRPTGSVPRTLNNFFFSVSHHAGSRSYVPIARTHVCSWHRHTKTDVREFYSQHISVLLQARGTRLMK